MLARSARKRCREVGHNAVTATVLLAACWWQPAAALQVFDDKATFLAGTSATSASGPLPSLSGFVTQVVAGSVTITPITGASMVVGQTSPSHFGTALLPGNEITIVGPEDINFALSAPVFALGFDFAEPNLISGCGVACVNSTFGVTLRHGGTAVGSFSFNAPDGVAAFVGVWSDVPFDRVEVRETSGSIDSEFFGEIYTSAVSPVPELPTLLSFGLALPLLGVCLGRQRKRQSANARQPVSPA